MKKFLVIIALCIVSKLNAQIHQNDHLFLFKGSTSVTIGTGIPYIGIGEVAYGVTAGFTVGAIFGVTPLVEGYGIRVRGLIYENDDTKFRVHLRAPIFYYPKTFSLGAEPWWLTYPALCRMENK